MEATRVLSVPNSFLGVVLLLLMLLLLLLLFLLQILLTSHVDILFFLPPGPVSEFNIDYDPEAAKYVLENLPKTRLVTWEIGLSTERSWKSWHDILRRQQGATQLSLKLGSRPNCGVDEEQNVSLSALTMLMEQYLIKKWPNNGMT